MRIFTKKAIPFPKFSNQDKSDRFNPTSDSMIATNPVRNNRIPTIENMDLLFIMSVLYLLLLFYKYSYRVIVAR